VDGFGPPLNYLPRHIYGQSKDGQKLIVKVGKHILLTGGSLVTDGRVTQNFRKEKMRSNNSDDGN
jgi:hypothetical protein